MTARKLIATAVAAALGACGGSSGSTGDEFVDAMPDAKGLTLELQGGAAEVPPSGVGATQSPLTASDFHPPAAGELADLQARLKGLNAVVVGALARVDELVGAQPNALPGDVRVFGPRDLPAGAPAGTFRLTARKRAAGRFGYKLEGKPLGAPDGAYAVVAAGTIVRTAEPARRGRGTIGIDADALHGVNAGAYPATGKLLAAFAHTGQNGKALAYLLSGFDADGPGPGAAATARIVAWRSSATLATRVRTAGLRDYVGPDVNPAGYHDELVVDHFGWNPTVQKARDYTVATNWVDASQATHGDVEPIAGQNAFWLGRACWAGGVKQYQDWVACRWAQAGAACALEVIALGTTNNPRYVKDATLPLASQTWAVACAGVAQDDPPTTAVGAEPTDTAEGGPDADPGAPPSQMPSDPTS